jgi:hypothetical protein
MPVDTITPESSSRRAASEIAGLEIPDSKAISERDNGAADSLRSARKRFSVMLASNPGRGEASVEDMIFFQ